MTALGLLRPEMLWLLLVVPVIGALVWRAERARTRATRVFAGNVPVGTRSAVRRWVKTALLLVALVAVIVALADPYIDLRQRTARRLGVDIVLAIDVSQSMAVRDVSPDRLRVARRFAGALGNEMLGSRVSLVLFAGGATVRYPATTDPRVLAEVLDSSGTGVRLVQGSSLRAGLDAAVSAFADGSGPQRQRAVVLVSDGEVTLGTTPDLAPLSESGARLYTIGVGTSQGGPVPTYSSDSGAFTGYLVGTDGRDVVSRLDEGTLRSLASAGKGAYWRYDGDDGVVRELGGRLRSLEATEEVQDPTSIPDERAPLFVAIAVVAIIAERFISDRRRVPVPVGTTPPRRRRRILGIAIGSAVLWGVACGETGVSNETGNQRFALGDYAGALAIYRQLQQGAPSEAALSVNAGNALHMLARYVDALPEYANASAAGGPEVRAVAQYDRGNTLFRLGRLEDARDAYREALRLDPSDRDAKFDLELVEQQLAAKTPPPKSDSRSSGAPGSSGRPAGGGGGQPDSSAGPNASGSPAPGSSAAPDKALPPGNDTANDGSPDITQALDEFRGSLTLDEALRVLDALKGQDRGIAQLIEGPRSVDAGQKQY